jgi:hypothetical protein
MLELSIFPLFAAFCWRSFVVEIVAAFSTVVFSLDILLIAWRVTPDGRKESAAALGGQYLRTWFFLDLVAAAATLRCV